MNGTQYEELCRFFLADRLGLDPSSIKSGSLPNPKRPDLPQYKHQIDLYWETGDDLALIFNIANAKWRGSDKVDQPEVMLLQQVRQKVAAHKAFMLTTVGFTSGAEAAGRDEGIALHVVTPALDTSLLPTRGRAKILAEIERQSTSSDSPIYRHEIVHRAYELPGQESANTDQGARRRPRSGSPAVGTPVTRVAPAGVNRALHGRGEKRVGGGSPQKGGGRGGEFGRRR